MLEKICVFLLLGVNSYVDIGKKEISLPVTGLLCILGIGSLFCTNRNTGSLLLSLAIGCGFIMLSLLTGGALGMGDGLLLLVLGFWLEWEKILFITLTGLLLCAVWSITLMVVFHKGRSEEIPFVPFLFLGYVGGLMIW